VERDAGSHARDADEASAEAQPWLRQRLRSFAGTPRDIGRASGRALGSRLEANIVKYIRERPQRPDALDLEELRQGALPWLRTLPSRFQEELEGLAEGAGLSIQRVAEWSYVESCVDDGCSGFVGMIDGRAWVARNNDMYVPGIWGYATVREVAGRIPTLSLGLEGDVFTATGVNRDRLWLHHQALPVTDAPRPGRTHLPGWVLLTDMLETCSTIADVEARLLDVDRDEGMTLLVVDGRNNEVAILECECSRHVRRVQDGPWLVATNHACAVNHLPPDEGSRSRQARMEVLARALDGCDPRDRPPQGLVAILADDAVERRGRDFSTVYAAVGCPGTGELWFTFGGEPAASRGEWRPIPWPW
jgi:hypothetical protein